jgi:hypothetical protein
MSNRNFRITIDVEYDDEDFGGLSSEAITKHLEDAVDRAVYDHALLHIEGKCFADLSVHIAPHAKPVLIAARRDAASTLRDLADYADASDPQLIDALYELACLCEADAPIPLIQDKLRLLASEVQPQDAPMASDLRTVVIKLDLDCE